MVLVEHRLDLTAKYADHLIVMDRGRSPLDGDPRTILNLEETRFIGVGIPKATSALSNAQKRRHKISPQTPLSWMIADQLLEALGPH